MNTLAPTMASQVAQAASEFQQQRTGRAPTSVAAVLSGETLVVTLYGVLSPAEKALAKNPQGSIQVQEFHRQLFNCSSEPLRQAIKKITGVEFRETTVEAETTIGTMVQVFFLAQGVPEETWRGSGRSDQT